MENVYWYSTDVQKENDYRNLLNESFDQVFDSKGRQQYLVSQITRKQDLINVMDKNTLIIFADDNMADETDEITGAVKNAGRVVLVHDSIMKPWLQQRVDIYGTSCIALDNGVSDKKVIQKFTECAETLPSSRYLCKDSKEEILRYLGYLDESYAGRLTHKEAYFLHAIGNGMPAAEYRRLKNIKSNGTINNYIDTITKKLGIAKYALTREFIEEKILPVQENYFNRLIYLEKRKSLRQYPALH